MIGDFTFANNVIYNYKHRTIDGGDHRSFYNIINNYFKPGPGTPKAPVAYRILKPESERSKVVFDNFGKAYVSGNYVDGYPDVTVDNWNGGVQPDSKAPLETILPNIKLDQPYPHAAFTMQTATEAYELVLQNAGATLPKRDQVDQRIVHMVRTGTVTDTQAHPDSLQKAIDVRYAPEWVKELSESVHKGYITDPREVGGYPVYEGTAYQDTDKDGLPNAWELKYHLDPNDPQDAVLDNNKNGYSNIEEFINNTNPS